MRGGFRFPKLEGEPPAGVEEVALSGPLWVPLRQGFGGTCAAVVKAGDRVVRGQVLGRAEGEFACPVHAPASGSVAQIGSVKIGDDEVPAICIEPDGRNEEERLPGATASFEQLPAEEVQRLLHEAGVGSLFFEGLPAPAAPCLLPAEQVKFVAIAALATEPFLPKLRSLLDGRLDDFVIGLRVLHQAFPEAKIAVGHSRADSDLLAEVHRRGGAPPWLTIRPLVAKYPQEHPALLVTTLLAHKKVITSPAAVGAVVSDAQAVLHAKEAVVDGRPITERLIALGGNGFSRGGYAKVRVGTGVRALVSNRLTDQAEPYLVLGGLFTGFRVTDLEVPVTRTTAALACLPLPTKAELLGSFRPGARNVSASNAFLAAVLPFGSRRLVASLHGERRPCVQCNYCEDVCPVEIIPHLLSKQVTHGLVDESERFGILSCIECGLCSYVCPSKIDLLADIRLGKRTLMQEKEKYAETA
ncbi:MAG: 4Fe-4S dicluster domain-containing protein [Calditrichaeota bacterium]|nr:4Fe-4S dicluster domain-containing protein [Calditrichota bacterium]